MCTRGGSPGFVVNAVHLKVVDIQVRGVACPLALLPNHEVRMVLSRSIILLTRKSAELRLTLKGNTNSFDFIRKTVKELRISLFISCPGMRTGCRTEEQGQSV